MAKETSWWITDRAEYHARFVLSKHHPMTVQPYPGNGSTLNLRFELVRRGKPSLRFFGAQILALEELPELSDAEAQLDSHLGKDPFAADFPVLGVIIGAQKPDGLVRWVAEPVIEADQPVLKRSGGELRPLDEDDAARLIDQIDAWYDKRMGRAAAKTNGRRSKFKAG